MLRWRQVFARLSILVFLASVGLAQTPPASVFNQVDQMVEALSRITGWKVTRKVPSRTLDKDSFRKYVESRMKDEASPKEVHAQETVLKMFGFVPPDFNLERETVDLVSEQAAAFYDYDKKRLFLLNSTTDSNEQRVALVHELAHALADQHYSLSKFLRKGSPDDDAETARQAVMEGQATWLTWAYVSERNGGKPEVPPKMLDELSKSLGADGSDYPVYTHAPLYMRESLVFPYSAGMRFQDAVYRKLGREGFTEVFIKPPDSTQQILHPEDYLRDKEPLDPAPAPITTVLDKKAAKKFRVAAEGSMGEFDDSVLLRQYVGDKTGADAASHWRGGSYRLYENKREKYPVLSYVSEWDSPAAARTFFDLYLKVMKGKWKSMTVAPADAVAEGFASGEGDTGRFRLSVSGTTVQSFEGLR